VAAGQTTTVASAEIPSGVNPADIEFRSDSPGAVTVSPTQATDLLTQLSITGAVPGEATIHAFNSSERVGTLNVAVYQPQLCNATATVIGINKKLNCAPPATVISAPTLENQLNMIFDQAAITYNLGLHAKFDDVNAGGTDCILDILDPVTQSISPELVAVDKRALDKKAQVNIYFVHQFGWLGDPSNLGISIRSRVDDLPIILVRGDGDQTDLSTELLTAHELGHDLGLPHCDENLSIDNHCARDEVESLMHSKNRGAILHKPEWDCASLGEGCKLLPNINAPN